MITFDDGRANTYEGMMYAASKGLVGTQYLVTSFVDAVGYLSTEQIVTLDNSGWAMASHTHTHQHLITLTQPQQEAEFTDAQAFLDSVGLTYASRHVAYPYGEYDEITLSAMTATGMLTGRKTDLVATIDPATAVIYEIPIVLIIGASTTMEQAKNAIRAAVEANNYCLLSFHGLVDSSPSALEWLNSDFRELIDWIVSMRIPTKTIVDFYSDTL